MTALGPSAEASHGRGGYALTSAVRDVLLRDGTALRLRAPGRNDIVAMLALFEHLSERSLYFRFHGSPPLQPGLVAPFAEPDWAERGSLIGSVGENGTERVIALGSWARLRVPGRAEIAFAVADDYQGRGVGTRLLEQLAELAA